MNARNILLGALMILLGHQAALTQELPTIAPGNESRTGELMVAPVHVELDNLDQLLTNLAAGKPFSVLSRVVEFGEVRTAEPPPIERLAAEHDLTAGIVRVNGRFGGAEVLEEYRLLDLDSRVIFIHDVHISPTEDSLALARSTPVQIDDFDTSAPALAREVKAALIVPRAAVLPTPSITRIGGMFSDSAGVYDGVVRMSCGANYNGGRVVNDVSGVFPWTVVGVNFGTQQGTVTLAGQAVVVRGWTNTQIALDPTVSFNAAPQSTLLVLRRPDGVTTAYGVGLVPAVRGRVFGQCTQLVAQRRLQKGMQPSPTAYGGYQTITINYIPRVGDQYQWLGRHTAIATSVQGPFTRTGGYVYYSITITEANAICDNQIRSYSATFETRTVNGAKTVTQYPRSSIAGFGSSTLYYR